ncbi:transcriptional regulator, SARP family [Kribbella flavida DSM 17836]|uniref:Transcriptional regulator, SARP family n=1 Tax=Kribbella flavida (strain DSM 17836 / JCM 10339 / NBRC 14399) TaxID=479435 RepID=D2PYL9_KRIFD|nr:AfsR/SARP family transcriptional regulator [Kribbella flavida]ADB29865.1 transcriptional regulator, SARP family [Kribbella flavida DSM 17836]
MNGHAAHTPARLAFRVLGPLEVDGPDGRPLDLCGGKPATVLTLLLLHRNAWVSTDQLIEAVWSGLDAPASAQRNLKTYVWQLRRALPDERIESRPGAYRVRVLPGELDADEAASLADSAHKLLTADRPCSAQAAEEAAQLVEHALGLWRGCPYDGLTGDATSAVDRLTELHRTLREDLADAHLALGRSADAIALLRALTDEDPLRELAWTRLMAALWQTGRRHDALAAYQRARGVLIRDLGIEPGAELTALHHQILTSDVTPAPQPIAVQAITADPEPLDATYSDLPPRTAGFVGRAADLAAVRDAVSPERMTVVAVEGLAGIGKSAFAVEAAARIKGVEWKHHVDLRAHRDGPVSPFEALGVLLQADRPETSLPTATAARTALWRSHGRPVLLVLDDVADAEQVHQLLPNAPGSLVIVTSRNRLAGLDCDVLITLDPLRAEEAEQLTDSAQVLRWSAGHPAALRRLSDSLRSRRPWTAARLATRLDDQTTRYRELATVHAQLDPTYESLPAQTRRFYRLLSLTPQFDVRRAAQLTGLAQAEVEQQIDELMDRYLLSEPAPGRFELHVVVRDHAHRLALATESHDDLLAAAQRVRISHRAALELVAPDDPRVA